MHIDIETNELLTWMGRETTEWDGVALYEAETFGNIFAVSPVRHVYSREPDRDGIDFSR